MTNPNPDGIRSAMDLLEKHTIKSENADKCFVNMGETECMFYEHRGNPCGTVACFGGWYAYASECEAGDPKTEVNHQRFPYNKMLSVRLAFEQNAYRAGRFLFARDISMSYADVRLWAYFNPDLWGNKNGGDMFGHRLAYIKEDRRLRLEDITAHWRGVADRIEAFEGKEDQ